MKSKRKSLVKIISSFRRKTSPKTWFLSNGTQLYLLRKKAERLSGQEIKKSEIKVAWAIADAFDEMFYLKTYSDVEEAGAEPLVHFVKYGWREGRDPAATFSTSYYLDSHPDVKASGVNPFWHYVVYGRHEGRGCRPGDEQDLRFDLMQAVRQATSVSERENRLAQSLKPAKGDLDDAALTALLDRLNSESKPVCVAFSHDDYARHTGGVQTCLRLEERAFRRLGWSYLHVYPVVPRTWLVEEEKAGSILWGLNLNGERIGTCLSSSLVAAIKRPLSARVRAVVHSPLGHCADDVLALGNALGGSKDWLFWVHDNTPYCPSFQLMRNNVVYCGAPDFDSVQCRMCAFGDDRRLHVERLKRFFAQTRPRVMCPSAFVSAFWERKSPHAFSGLSVVEHCAFGATSPRKPVEGRVRVAYVGTRAIHKGWNEFVSLVETLREDDRFEFHVFASDAPSSDLYSFHETKTSGGDVSAMREKLVDNDVDVALVWSKWPETFCLAAYEALSAGALVVTNAGAGNVPDVVRKTGKGFVLDDENALLALFAGDRLYDAAMANRRKGRYAELLSGGLSTFDLRGEKNV